MTDTFQKDPNARLDYTVDWSAWLGSDTIAAVTWSVPPGITQVRASASTTAATIVLAAGTAGFNYRITCEITTAAGLIDLRAITIQVRTSEPTC